MINYYYPSELYHYGMPRRSGRYPWGSGDRPYQNSDGSGKKLSRKEAKRRALEIKKEQEQEKHINDKERVLKSGRASEISKYRGELSKKELQEAYNRLNLERKIDEMSATEALDNNRVINKTLSTIEKTTNWVVKGAVSYNILASLYNGLVDDSKKLPILKIVR